MINSNIVLNESIYKHWFLFPIIVFALSIYPYVYMDVLGEADLVHVVFGLLYNAKNGIDAGFDLKYGVSFSFGYYWFIYHFLPNQFLTHSDLLIRFINTSGFFSALLLLISAGWLLSRIYNPLTALLAVSLFGFSPMFIELATSGHQILSATALFLMAGNVLLSAESSTRFANYLMLSLVSLFLLVSALSVRAETALALPWLICATSVWAMDRGSLRKFLARLAIVAMAIIFFLYFQGQFLEPHKSASSEIGTYLSAFYNLNKMQKGVVLFIIAFGIASTVAGVIIPLSKLKFPALRKYYFHALILIIPTLLLWLPNPQPSRHFLFAFLGLAILMGNIMPLAFPKQWHAIIAATAIVIANQLIIELLHPAIVSRYEWSYPQIGERRSTYGVPIGFFPLDHQANQKNFAAFRDEGRAVAKMTDPHVLIFGDEIHYILISLLDSDSNVIVSKVDSPPGAVIIKRDHQKFELIPKQINWPSDTVAEYIASHDVSAKTVYVQPYTISKYDQSTHRKIAAVH
jgi:hypothetical protein